MPSTHKEATLHWIGKKPTGKRARDFVKCDDPECIINKTWKQRILRFGWTADDYQPHCHPIF